MADAEPNRYTAEDFITRWSLYTPFPASQYTPPNRISFECFADCAKETTWSVAGRGSYAGFTYVQYQCTLCCKAYLVVLYREAGHVRKAAQTIHGTEELWVPTQVIKIGQFPPLSIDIPKALQKNLGDAHTCLYRKALINRNEGYGLGAVSYMRRVVEDQTEELIEVVAQLAEAHQIDGDIIKKIRAAKEERTTYDQKLKIAATVVPRSLVIDGVNPLDVLYKLVSAGLHDLTEEQCIQVADETKSVFEYTFTRLRAEIDERRDFAAKVRKWAGGALPVIPKSAP